MKTLHVNDLIALRGIDPPPPHPVGNLPPGRLEEIQAVFLATYAPAIDKLLEVRWYSEKALSVLMADSQLMADYSALINAFNEWNLADRDTVARLESFEASIIWRSMVLCRQVPSAENGQYGQDWNLLVTNARLNAIEALLSWNHMDQNALSRPLGMDAATPPNSPDQFLQRQLDFWSELGDFLTLHDNEASSAKQIDDTLTRLRSMLDTYENRDIIYSIAIARHLGQRWGRFSSQPAEDGLLERERIRHQAFRRTEVHRRRSRGQGHHSDLQAHLLYGSALVVGCSRVNSISSGSSIKLRCILFLFSFLTGLLYRLAGIYGSMRIYDLDSQKASWFRRCFLRKI